MGWLAPIGVISPRGRHSKPYRKRPKERSTKLAGNALGRALDALESGKLIYETEPRCHFEMAN